MTVLINLIVFVLLSKYVLLVLGFGVCYVTTLGMRVFSGCGTVRQPLISIRSAVAEDTGIGTGSLPLSNTLIKQLMSLVAGYINGWLRYAGMYTGRIPSHRIRNFLYRHVFHMKMGRKSIIYGGSEIRAPYNIEIGERSIIGDDSKLDGRNGIVIGTNVNLSTGVWIWTDEHDPQCPHFSGSGKGGPVRVGDRAWISCRTVILPGVTIGEGAVVAAGAVVTQDVEPYAIYGGIPAKKIGHRRTDLVYELNGRPLAFY